MGLSTNIGPIDVDIEKEKHVWDYHVYSHVAKHMDRYPNVKKMIFRCFEIGMKMNERERDRETLLYHIVRYWIENASIFNRDSFDQWRKGERTIDHIDSLEITMWNK